MKWCIFALVLPTFAARALAADEVPDKSAYTLFNPTPDDDLRSFDADRPTKSYSPYTVDAGHFQYETDIAVFGYRNTDGVKTEAWTVLDPTLKLGLTNTIDAELQITPYESVVVKGAGYTTSISGVGDTFARLKINVLGDDRGAVAVALLPYVKLPTAKSGLGNGSIEGGLILPISISAPAGFTVVVMPEGDYLKDAVGGGHHVAFDFLINISHPLDKRWAFYAELFTNQSFRSQDKAVYTLDAALSCALTSNVQLDFGGNFSLNDVAPRTQLYAGLSQRF
jgi:Putative MetA-pathway of phenol degradation